MNFLGKHIILELYQCPADMLSNPVIIEKYMKEAAIAMGATIVESTFHHFSPLGVSGVIVIKESHLTIHTWPEHQYAAVDMFTCGDIQMERGVALLKENLRAGSSDMQILKRGIFDPKGKK